MNNLEWFYCNEVFDSPSDLKVHIIKYFEEKNQKSILVDESFKIESDGETQFTLGTDFEFKSSIKVLVALVKR